MKTKRVVTFVLFLILLGGCKSLSSHMDYSELKDYNAKMHILNNILLITLDNPPGLMVSEIDGVQKDGNTYLVAYRISSGGGTKEYKIYLPWRTLPADIKEHLFWVNPDSSVNPVYPEYLK